MANHENQLIEEVNTGNAVANRYVVNRPVRREKDFHTSDRGSAINPKRSNLPLKTKQYFKSFKLVDFIKGLFPILSWLPNYKIKEFLAGDVISGITVGVVHIPQSISFALIAGLPPVFGLYTTFWPVLFYAFMGTSRQLSVGTFAITSLLTQPVVYRYFPDPPVVETPLSENVTATPAAVNMTGGFPEIGVTEFYANRVGVAAALMMLMGIFQFIFGLLRLGMVTTYMSEPLVQGFTTGAAMHVALSQMPLILGITPKPMYGWGSFYMGCIYIFKNFPNIHVATLIISLICITLLVLSREINIRYKNKLKVPIPMEVILVVLSILVSHFGRFNDNFGVPVVGEIPLGFPKPRLPNTSILGDIVGDAFSIAIVGFALNIGVARFYSIKYDYPIDANQELLAYGVGNFVPSFFLCFPNCAALARCQILDQSGGKTQLVGFLTVLILLITIVGIGPVFYNLPKGVAGCIIFCGLIGIFEQFHLVRPLWKTSKPDCVVFIFTFLAVCSLGVDFGLYSGIIFALLVALLRTQVANSEVLGNVDNTDVYRSVQACKHAISVPGVVIYKFNSMLYYVNKENFKQMLFKAIGFIPADVLRIRKKKERKDLDHKKVEKKKRKKNKLQDDKVSSAASESPRNIEVNSDESGFDPKLKTVIIDCAAFSMIDIVGVKTLKLLFKNLKELGIQMLLANVSKNVREYLDAGSFYELAGEEVEFISIHDAVLYAQNPTPVSSKSDDDLTEDAIPSPPSPQMV